MSGIYVQREEYLRTLKSYRKNPEFVKVITGVRRCGKSELMKQFCAAVSKSEPKTQVIRLDLEEKRYEVDSERSLYDYLSRAIERKGPVIALDEVQVVKGWEKVVEAIRLAHNADIYVTGSNSETVSESLGTHLTGRYVEIHILPFSFREFIVRYPVVDGMGYSGRLEQYIRYGGMPIVDLDDDGTKNRTVLRGLYDSVINKDIRPGMEMNQQILDNITKFMFSNIGNLTSFNNIAKESFVTDPRTVEKYLGKLCGSFLFYRADRFDIVGKKHMRTNAKFYSVDNGFGEAVLTGSEYDKVSALENAVFLELLRRGYRVSVGSYRDNEVDFTAWKDGKPEFFQVSYNLNDASTEREIRAFKSMGAGKRIVIAMEGDIPQDSNGIEFVKAEDFFLGV